MSITAAQDNIFVIYYYHGQENFFIDRVLCWATDGRNKVVGLMTSDDGLCKVNDDCFLNYVKLTDDEAKQINEIFNKKLGMHETRKEISKINFTYFNTDVLQFLIEHNNYD